MLILGLQSPGRPNALHRRRVSIGVRQDQPGDAGAAGVDAGLEGVHRRRRHRLAATRQPTGGCGRSIRRPASSASRRARAARPTPTRCEMIQRNTIFTNVALRPDGTPWWEGHDDPPPAEALDWQGRPWTPAPARRPRIPTAASRRRRPSARSLSPEFDNPNGVPIDAILFGARRAAARAAGLRVAQLAARHVSRGDDGVGDNRGGDRQGRRAAPRSDGHAAVLRLQHGRLLRALARDRRRARETAARSST